MDNILAKLKENGLKLTPRRKAIIRLFYNCGSHLTPEEVLLRLREQFERCGLPGVYRNLESLTGCGILTRIQKFDRKKHYSLCSARGTGHHHHITCIKCGKVEVIENCAISGVKKINGYKVVSHFMQVNGVCGKCTGTEIEFRRQKGK